MTIATYMQNLKYRQDLSYMQLAKDIGISYQNMMDLKNGRIVFVSSSVLMKLSKYEKKKQEDILYEILKDDVDDDYPMLALKYMCSKYVEGYSVTINPNVLSPFEIGQIKFNGFLLKKRTGNNYIAIDSWQKIKSEHWNIFKEKSKINFSNDAYIRLFKNKDLYIANVISWAIQRVLISNVQYIKGYTILFENNENNDYNLASKYLVKYSTFKITLLSL